MDRRFGEELLRVLSPLGVRASLEALERLTAADEAQREALTRQLEQVEYEARRAFAQYHAVDPRNRLLAAELERRWNATLEELETVKARLAELQREPPKPSVTRTGRRSWRMGAGSGDVWHSAQCPTELKKRSSGGRGDHRDP